jgi:hypothetical protein
MKIGRIEDMNKAYKIKDVKVYGQLSSVYGQLSYGQVTLAFSSC